MRASTADAQGGAARALEDAFEPAAKKLADIWMDISDLGCALRRAVDELAGVLGDRAKTLGGEVKRLDDLVFSSIEVMDDLFTLVRRDLASRREQANRALPVSALDAFLDGVTVLPPRPGEVNRATIRTTTTTTPEQASAAATAVVTPSPSPMAARPKMAQTSSMKMFDLLRGLHRQRAAMGKGEVKQDATAAAASEDGATATKKRSRSPVAADSEPGGEAGKKRQYNRVPKSMITGRRPIAVHGVRKRLSQREYAVEYEGLSEYVWLTSRQAAPAAKAMIQAYAKSLRAKRHREKLRHAADAAASARQESVGGDDVDEDAASDALDNDGMYIVEKIVDHRIRYGKKQYFVKWDGYDSDENTWEPAGKLRAEVRSVVEEYERDLAKAAARKAADDRGEPKHASTPALNAGAAGSKANAGRPAKPKVALGRPSHPGALTKSVPSSTSAELLQRSGKIPKVHFLIKDDDTDDEDDEEEEEEEDPERLRLAASDDDEEDEELVYEDDDHDDRISGAFGGRKRRATELSPQVE